MEYDGKTFADYFALLKRRRFLIIFCFMPVFLAGVYLAFALPSVYRSTATILIEQQDIPEAFAQTTVTSYADEQIQLVQQRVMSTATLTRIVEEYGLYPDIVGSGSVQLAVDELRANTLLETVSAEVVNRRSGREMLATIAFNLSLEYSDPGLTQRVTQELADLYLQENAQSRTAQVQGTIDFVQAEVERTRQEADRTGKALADFKERHAGSLPDLLNFYLQSADRTEQQLDNLDREIRDSRNRLFTLQTELTRTNPTMIGDDGEPVIGSAQRLAELQNERLRLLSIYTPIHPQVVRVEREIEMLTRSGGDSGASAPSVQDLRTRLETATAELRAARDRYSDDHPDVARLTRSVQTLQQQLEQSLTSPQQRFTNLAAQDPMIQQLRQQVDAEQSYLRSLTNRQSEFQARLTDLQSRVAEMPRIEREYEILFSESEVANRRYSDAVAKLDEAQRARTLEAGGSGERFTLIEPPRLPSAPYSPNRMAIVLLSIVLATGISIGFATIRDSVDDSVKSSRELLRLTAAPPLAVIPFIETVDDRRRRIGMNMAASTIVAGGLAAAFIIATAMG